MFYNCHSYYLAVTTPEGKQRLPAKKDGIEMGGCTTAHSPKVRPDAVVDIPQILVSEGVIVSAYREGADAAVRVAYAFSCPCLNDLENAAKYAAWMEGFGSSKQR